MHRILFTFFGIPIYTYGIMVALAVLCALLLVNYRNRQKQITTTDNIYELFTWMVISGVVGARIVYVLSNLSFYISRPALILNIREGGIALHGAILAGALALYFYCKSKKLDPAVILDLFAPAMLLGIAIGRLGCFFNGCCVGIAAPPPFGIHFADAGIPGLRYPTQLYEMVLDLIAVFLILRRDAVFAGHSFLKAISLYSMIRFVIEFYRESYPRYLGLSIAQYVSIVILILALFLMKYGLDHGHINIFKKSDK